MSEETNSFNETLIGPSAQVGRKVKGREYRLFVAVQKSVEVSLN